MADPVMTLSPAQLGQLVQDAGLFAGEANRYARCEAADAEVDANKRLTLRRAIVTDGFLWRPPRDEPGGGRSALWDGA